MDINEIRADNGLRPSVATGKMRGLRSRGSNSPKTLVWLWSDFSVKSMQCERMQPYLLYPRTK